MSRAVGNPILADFLQDRVNRLLAETGMTQKALAEKAGLSAAQVSDVRNKAVGVGYTTATKLGRVLGYKNLGELEAAAEVWNESERPRVQTQPPSRRKQQLLRERDEWDIVVRLAKDDRPYISDESFERVGRIQDNEVDFPEKLSFTLVGDLAEAFMRAHSRKRTPAA